MLAAGWRRDEEVSCVKTSDPTESNKPMVLTAHASLATKPPCPMRRHIGQSFSSRISERQSECGQVEQDPASADSAPECVQREAP